MSLATERAAIAAQLDAVAGVKGYQYMPAIPKTGDAWPTLPTLALQDGLVWRPTWTIHVSLPTDARKAAEWMDTHFDDLALALRGGNTFPDTAEPVVVGTDNGNLLLLEITVRSH